MARPFAVEELDAAGVDGKRELLAFLYCSRWKSGHESLVLALISMFSVLPTERISKGPRCGTQVLRCFSAPARCS